MKYFFLLLVTFFLTSCEDLALLFTPKKQPVMSNNSLATEAEQRFWTTLHQGNYQDIPATTQLLTAAYLKNPNDPKLAAHLGFLHIWKITERRREKTIPSTITNEIILAKKYFSDAVELDPSDARYLGFLGDSQLVEGQIFNDKREETRGYFTLKRAIRAWPQFNYFSAGFPMSTLPHTSKYFREGLEWQWDTLNLCAGEKVDRNNPDFAPYMKLETQQGPARACWNSWIAPHNFEGFFLNMGDMLVKSGDWQTAIKIYRNAQLSKTYAQWPYRSLLEKRISQAQDNVAQFQKDTQEPSNRPIAFNSGYGCVMCHQQR